MNDPSRLRATKSGGPERRLFLKFSNLFNRFRALNQERRLLEHKPNRTAAEEERFGNLKAQLTRLTARATHTKNAILLNFAAIVCFISTSVCLFLNLYTPFELSHFTITFFITGLLLVLISTLLMILEVRISFRILKLEQKS